MMSLWRVEEAAEYLGIRPKTLYEWVRLDRVPYRKIGFNVRFDPDDLARWTEKQSRGGTHVKAAGEGVEVQPRRKNKAAVSERDVGRSKKTADASVGEGDDTLRRLTADASTALRTLERDLGASLSFPQRRRLLELADRLDSAASGRRSA
jgi:excisionase family DNA binding protein